MGWLSSRAPDQRSNGWGFNTARGIRETPVYPSQMLCGELLPKYPASMCIHMYQKITYAHYRSCISCQCWVKYGKHTDEGFFLAYENSAGRFDDNLFPASASSQSGDSFCTPVPLFYGQNQATVSQWAEMTVAECSLMSCMWTCWPDRFPHYAWTV